MKSRGPDLEPELEALLEPRKIQRQLPPELRAQVLARARATLAGDVIPSVSLPQARPMPAARGGRLLRIALVASVAVAGAAVGAVAALQRRSAPTPQVTPPHDAPRAPRPPTTRADDSPSEPRPAATERPATGTSQPIHLAHPARAAGKADPFTAELDLLQRAHGAYTRHDFSSALTLIAEHARRFPNGHLAEQREGLRVRSLRGAGRIDEAHRAAAAFAARFPRSVLLSRAAGGSESSEP
jgi:hypothetical protein